MKIKVKSSFVDKYTRELYQPGANIDIDDKDRVNDLIARGLAEAVEEADEAEEKPKKKAKK